MGNTNEIACSRRLFHMHAKQYWFRNRNKLDHEPIDFKITAVYSRRCPLRSEGFSLGIPLGFFFIPLVDTSDTRFTDEITFDVSVSPSQNVDQIIHDYTTGSRCVECGHQSNCRERRR